MLVSARMLNGWSSATIRSTRDALVGSIQPSAAIGPGFRMAVCKVRTLALDRRSTGPGELAVDFRIDEPPAADIPVVNLFGIESPGLTASLAIAAHVASIVRTMR